MLYFSYCIIKSFYYVSFKIDSFPVAFKKTFAFEFKKCVFCTSDIGVAQASLLAAPGMMSELKCESSEKILALLKFEIVKWSESEKWKWKWKVKVKSESESDPK